MAHFCLKKKKHLKDLGRASGELVSPTSTSTPAYFKIILFQTLFQKQTKEG